jgi:hypothetical protein
MNGFLKEALAVPSKCFFYEQQVASLACDRGPGTEDGEKETGHPRPGQAEFIPGTARDDLTVDHWLLITDGVFLINSMPSWQRLPSGSSF